MTYERDQQAVMAFDPGTGQPKPYPSHAKQYRIYHGALAWLYDPWSGRRRNADEVGEDAFGSHITPHYTSIQPTGGCT